MQARGTPRSGPSCPPCHDAEATAQRARHVHMQAVGPAHRAAWAHQGRAGAGFHCQGWGESERPRHRGARQVGGALHLPGCQVGDLGSR